MILNKVLNRKHFLPNAGHNTNTGLSLKENYFPHYITVSLCSEKNVSCIVFTIHLSDSSPFLVAASGPDGHNVDIFASQISAFMDYGE